MNLLDRLRNFFRPAPPKPPEPPMRRNKPGGLAWIKFDPEMPDIAGQIVTTVKLNSSGNWAIHPVPRGTVTTPTQTVTGDMVWPGQKADVIGMADRLLEPIREVGDEERSQELDYLPKVKQGQSA